MRRGGAYRKTDTPRALVSRDAPANFVLFIQSILIDGIVGNAAILGALMFGARISHWHIPFNLYTLPAYFLAAEFWHYIYHRMSHEVRIFWADHSIHHSSRDYEFFTSWRLTPFTFAYKAMTAIPLAMLGFGPVAFLPPDGQGNIVPDIHPHAAHRPAGLVRPVLLLADQSVETAPCLHARNISTRTTAA